MYSNRVPRFTVDLELDERDRWGQVIDADQEAALELVEAAEQVAEQVPGIVKRIAGTALSVGYRASGGRYQEELRAWGAALGRSFGDMVFMNCSYELSHVVEYASAFGCTAGVRWFPDYGMVHVRNLDWGLPLGRATRLFTYKSGKRSFVAVGVSGFVGVLSGMVPRAYSVTINAAPPDGYPDFSFGPAFLLREVLETCDTYAEAVEVLTHTELSTSVFFTVCGVEKGEACVIERLRDYASVRKFKKGALTQANHHVAQDLLWNNDSTMDTEDLRDSRERAKVLKQALEKLAVVKNLKEVASCCDREPVRNWETEQQMLFCPAKGKVHAWRRTSPGVL